MVKIVIDSSQVIDYTRVGQGRLPEILSLKRAQKAEVYVPTLVILELWAGMSMEDLTEEIRVKRLLLPLKTIDLTKQIAKDAGKLVRKKQIDSAFDSVVAATTLYLGAELATSNKKHFEKVKGLKIFD